MNSTIDILTPAKRFWRLLKPDQKEIQNVYVYSLFYGLVNLSLPLGIQAIVNLIQGGQMSTSWVVLVAIVVAGVAVSGIFQVIQLRITENLQQKIFARAAFEFAYRIPRVRMEALYRQYAPELMNRFFDVMTIQKGLSKIIIDFSAATLQIVFGLILLSFYHPFFIIFSLLLILAVYIILRISIPRGLKTSLDESKHKYEVAYWLEEVARTATSFKLSGTGTLPMTRTDKHVGDYIEARDSHFSVLIRHYSLMVIFKVLVASGLLAIGGILVMEQHMNIGQFVAAEIIILLVMASVEKLILSTETIYDVLTSLEKIGQVADLEMDHYEGIRLSEDSNSKGLEVEVSGMSFSYPGQSNETLKNINLHVKEGERIVITGPSGSGKSTLLQVIAALFEPSEGTLAYQGFSRGSLDINDLQSTIGACLSQEQLFNGTLLENISMGRPEVSMKNVQWAIENLGLLPFVKSLPKGYDSIIDPQGRKLPRSIIQKLIIARSIVDKPRLLLLETVLEKLDPTEFNSLIDFLFDPAHGWSIVAVSSNEYMAASADRQVIVENGTIK